MGERERTRPSIARIGRCSLVARRVRARFLPVHRIERIKHRAWKSERRRDEGRKGDDDDATANQPTTNASARARARAHLPPSNRISSGREGTSPVGTNYARVGKMLYLAGVASRPILMASSSSTKNAYSARLELIFPAPTRYFFRSLARSPSFGHLF